MLKNLWYVAEDSQNIGNKPTKVEIVGQSLVLFRQDSGQVTCLSDICLHRGASLSGGRVQNNCVECPYHGWQFDGNGKVVKIPAQGDDVKIPDRARIDSYPTEERYGWVWVFLGDLPEGQRPPIPAFPEYSDTKNWRCVRGEFKWNAHYARVIENGLDFAHAPFVHPGFGDRDDGYIEDFTIKSDEWGARAAVTYRPPLTKGMWKISRKAKAPVRASPGFHMCGGLMRLEVQISAKWSMIIYDVNTPIDESTTLTRWVMARNFFKGRWADRDAKRRVQAIFDQDAAVIEKVKPELLPIDLSEELSVKSDRLQIAYRRLRRQLIQKGWGLDYENYNGQMRRKIARVIPSPHRADPKNQVGDWVIPSLNHKYTPTEMKGRAQSPVDFETRDGLN